MVKKRVRNPVTHKYYAQQQGMGDGDEVSSSVSGILPRENQRKPSSTWVTDPTGSSTTVGCW